MVYVTYNTCEGKFEAYTVGCGVKNYLQQCGSIRQWDSRCAAQGALESEGYTVHNVA